MAARVVSSRLIWTAAIIVVFVALLSYSAHAGLPDLPHIPHLTKASSSSASILDSIYNETLGFQRIFVINLKTRTDRRDGMALAAGVTGLTFDFVEAVTEVADKAKPPGSDAMTHNNLASWRSHMNVARTMIEKNISSALVLEDDVDWDVRIKEQLYRVAQASQLLVQPIPGTVDQFLDPTYSGDVEGQEATTFVTGEHQVERPITSPYGDIDRWDLLWLGHCGAKVATGEHGANIPLGRAVILDDETVPEPHHIKIDLGDGVISDNYPAHTRGVFRTGGNVCSFAYAMTQAGARKLLYELSLHSLVLPFDNELDSFCRDSGRGPAKCLTVQPELFQHHRPIGKASVLSDITNHDLDDVVNDHPYTINIRVGTRVNLAKLVVGETDLLDQYRDGKD